MLGQALTPQPQTAEAGPTGSTWPWIGAILAGFAAALALAWVLRPRRKPAPEEIFAAAPALAPSPANDVDGPRRVFRREGPPPPRVTILAR